MGISGFQKRIDHRQDREIRARRRLWLLLHTEELGRNIYDMAHGSFRLFEVLSFLIAQAIGYVGLSFIVEFIGRFVPPVFVALPAVVGLYIGVVQRKKDPELTLVGQVLAGAEWRLITLVLAAVVGGFWAWVVVGIILLVIIGRAYWKNRP